MTWPVELSHHARLRARERFPGLDLDTTVTAEVHVRTILAGQTT